MILQLKMDDGTRLLFHKDEDGWFVFEELTKQGMVRDTWRLSPSDANELRKFLRTQGFGS